MCAYFSIPLSGGVLTAVSGVVFYVFFRNDCSGSASSRLTNTLLRAILVTIKYDLFQGEVQFLTGGDTRFAFSPRTGTTCLPKGCESLTDGYSPDERNSFGAKPVIVVLECFIRGLFAPKLLSDAGNQQEELSWQVTQTQLKQAVKGNWMFES